MRHCYGLLLAVSAFAQQSAPIGILRGDLVSIDNGKPAGELTVETVSGQIYGCHFDAHTYVERDNQRFSMAGIQKGDRLEIIADRKPGAPTSCYARTYTLWTTGPQ
jgi:hypothetical protein